MRVMENIKWGRDAKRSWQAVACRTWWHSSAENLAEAGVSGASELRKMCIVDANVFEMSKTCGFVFVEIFEMISKSC